MKGFTNMTEVEQKLEDNRIVQTLLTKVFDVETFDSWRDYSKKYRLAEYNTEDPFPAEKAIAYYNDEHGQWFLFSKDHWSDLNPFEPFTNISCAFSIVDAFVQKGCVVHLSTFIGCSFCHIHANNEWYMSNAKTLTRAICMAALQTIEKAGTIEKKGIE